MVILEGSQFILIMPLPVFYTFHLLFLNKRHWPEVNSQGMFLWYGSEEGGLRICLCLGHKLW